MASLISYDWRLQVVRGSQYEDPAFSMHMRSQHSLHCEFTHQVRFRFGYISLKCSPAAHWTAPWPLVIRFMDSGGSVG